MTIIQIPRNQKKIEENREREENKENVNEHSSRMSGFTSLLEGNSLTTNIWEVTEQERAAEKIRNDKAQKVKWTLAQFNVSSKEVVEWTSNNTEKYQEYSNKSKHDKYNTLKHVIKAIIRQRNEQEEQDDAFSNMMTMSNEKAR